MKLVSPHFWLIILISHIYIPNALNTVQVVTESGNRTFGSEWRVKQLLDRTLQHVQTSNHGTNMTISRYPTSNWELACEADTTNLPAMFSRRG